MIAEHGWSMVLHVSPRAQGDFQQGGDFELNWPVVPRVGETIRLDDETCSVRAVEYDADRKVITVIGLGTF